MRSKIWLRICLLTILGALHLSAKSEACPGRNLTAFRMSSVYFQGERVKPFLLNQNGEEYQPCSGESVEIPSQEDQITVGVRTADGVLHTVDYLQLLIDSREYSQSTEAITTLPGASERANDQCYENEMLAMDQAQNLLSLISLDEAQQEREEVLRLINSFHNDSAICSRLNSSSDRLDSLLEEWNQFCSERDERLCQRAKEVDMLTRTTVFEAHPLGQLDDVDVSDTASLRSLEFPLSRCERRFIAMTLRNRSGRRGSDSGLAEESPFFGHGLDGNIYNIWLDDFVRNSFISACFTRDAVLPSTTSDLSRNRYEIFRQSFISTVGDVYQTLYHPDEINQTTTLTNTRTGETEPIQNRIQHYYHPMAMPKCFFEDSENSGSWLVRSNAIGVIACREVTVDGSNVEDCALLKNEPHRINTETGEIQFVHRSNEQGAFSYAWTGGGSAWREVRTIYPRENSTTYRAIDPSGEYVRSNAIENRYCEAFDGDAPIGNKAPTWALREGRPSYYQVTCEFDGQSVSIGGEGDPRIIPVFTNE